MRLVDEKTFIRESRIRLEQLTHGMTPSVEQRALAVIRWVASSTVHSSTYQDELRALQEVLKKSPPLTDRIEAIAEDVTKEAGELYERVKSWGVDAWNRFDKPGK
jgi:hypothetical protein